MVRESLLPTATTEVGWGWGSKTLAELSQQRYMALGKRKREGDDGGQSSPIPGRSCLGDLVGGGPPTVAAAPHTAEGTNPPGPWP